jgi:hypothetical protein
MREILPGIFHWTTLHEKIRIRVHSYYLIHPRVLLDPMLPREGLAWFRAQKAPEHILLTNRHHYRQSARFVKAFGTRVHCHRAGLHEFTRGEEVEPFEHGDELAGGILALKVGALCPEETALYVPPRKRSGTRGLATAGILAFGDALIESDDGGLGFVPEKFMGEDPEKVKRGLRRALRRLLERDFEHLLMAHGAPILGDGKERLAQFLSPS